MISRVPYPINSASAAPTSLYFYFISNISHIRCINFIIILSDNIITKLIILKKNCLKLMMCHYLKYKLTLFPNFFHSNLLDPLDSARHKLFKVKWKVGHKSHEHDPTEATIMIFPFQTSWDEWIYLVIFFGFIYA